MRAWSRVRRGQSLEVGPEARIRDGNAVGARDLGAVANGSGQRKQHGHAMVTLAVRAAALESGSMDSPTIDRRRDVAAEGCKPVRYHRQAVRLLGPQFRCIADNGFAICKEPEQRHQRNLVDRQWDEVSTHVSTAQLAGGGNKVADWFARHNSLVLDTDVRSHGLEDRQQPGAGRVEANILDSPLRGWMEDAQPQPERRRGEVAPYCEV